jgi:hypothetical protein
VLTRRITMVAAIAAASLSLMAGSALAKGGGSGSGGGSQPAPAPAPAPDPAPEPSGNGWTLCPEYATSGFDVLPDGSTLFANEIAGVACLVARSTPSGVLSIYQLRLGAGWVASTKSAGGGNSNRIDIEISNPSTGDKHSILVAPGKTVIR